MPVSTPQMSWPRFLIASIVGLFTSCAMAGAASTANSAAAISTNRTRNIFPLLLISPHRELSAMTDRKRWGTPHEHQRRTDAGQGRAPRMADRLVVPHRQPRLVRRGTARRSGGTARLAGAHGGAAEPF